MNILDLNVPESLGEAIQNPSQVLIIEKLLEKLEKCLDRVLDKEIYALIQGRQEDFRGHVERFFSNRANSIANVTRESLKELFNSVVSKDVRKLSKMGGPFGEVLSQEMGKTVQVKKEYQSLESLLKRAVIQGIKKGSRDSYLPFPNLSSKNKEFIHEYVQYRAAEFAWDAVRRCEDIEKNFAERAFWIADFHLKYGQDLGVQEHLKKIRKLFIEKYNITTDFDGEYASLQTWAEKTGDHFVPASPSEALFVLASAYRELEKKEDYWGSELVRQIRVAQSMKYESESENGNFPTHFAGRCMEFDEIVYLVHRERRKDLAKTTRHEFAHLLDHTSLTWNKNFFGCLMHFFIQENPQEELYRQGFEEFHDLQGEREDFAGHAALQGNPVKIYALASQYPKMRDKGERYSEYYGEIIRFFKTQNDLRKAVQQKADIRIVRTLCRDWVKQGKEVQRPSSRLFKKGLEMGLDKKFLMIQMDKAVPYFTYRHKLPAEHVSCSSYKLKSLKKSQRTK